jgi:hypothetical protein
MLWEEQTWDAPTKKKSTLQKSCTTQRRSPTRYKAAKHTYHLLGPSSRHTIARRRATTHPDTHNLSCTGRTTRRPQPPHQHLKPAPWPKSHTASSETCRPSRQPRRTSDTRLPPNSWKQLPHETVTQHGLRGRRLNSQVLHRGC